MKKPRIFVFSMLSLLVLSLVGTAAAYNADYSHTNYFSDYTPTVDGTYIMDDEWLASGTEYFGTDNSSIFRDEWTSSPAVLACLFIETTDNTTDTNDKWIICYDSTETGELTPPDGGAAPTEFDYKLEVTGHGTSETVEWFRGTGSGWTSITPDASIYDVSQALTTTPKILDEHYALELTVVKTDTSLGSVIMGYNWAQFVSYYDANTTTTQQWPPADTTPPGSPDVPDSWGYIEYTDVANPTPDLPDGISIVAMVVVSSAATVGAVLFRKRSK